VCGPVLVNLRAADVVSAVNGEWEQLALITGFHSVTPLDSPFHLRVIEANGQATVAINPITLFFVVTNDSSAGDLQQHIWRLPVRVARVRSVVGVNSGVRILAILEGMPNADVKTREVNILVRYNTERGVLKDTITVQQEELR
jgi:hypothetical protein